MVGILVDVLRELVLSLYFVDLMNVYWSPLNRLPHKQDSPIRAEYVWSRVLDPVPRASLSARRYPTSMRRNKETVSTRGILLTEGTGKLCTPSVLVRWARTLGRRIVRPNILQAVKYKGPRIYWVTMDGT